MPASFRLAAASAVAASLFATAVPARSADLYQPRFGSAYDEPRYGDAYGESYGEESSTYEQYADPQDEYEPPYRPHTSFKGFKDESYEHESFKEEVFRDHYAPARSYADRGEHCIPRHIARARLRDEGWRQFRNFEQQGRVVLAQARGPSGGLFDLTIDRCSGEILAARKLYDGRTYAGNSRRYWQPYSR